MNVMLKLRMVASGYWGCVCQKPREKTGIQKLRVREPLPFLEYLWRTVVANASLSPGVALFLMWLANGKRVWGNGEQWEATSLMDTSYSQ